MIHVTAYRNPYGGDPLYADVRGLQTVRDIVGNVEVLAWINGRQVPAEFIDKARIKDGQQLTVCVQPHGSIGRIIGLIVIAVAAAFTGGAALAALTPVLGSTLAGVAAAFVSVAASVIGSLLLNALIPPPKPKSPSSQSFNRRESLTGASNQIASFTPIPRIYGTFRFFPPIPSTAKPFTELVGDDQFLRLMFVLGYGPLQIGGVRAGDGSLITHNTVLAGSPVKIGETDAKLFQGVEFEIGDPADMTLYVTQINEINPQFVTSADISGIGGGAGGQFVPNGASAVRTTDANVTEISVSVEYPAGIFAVNSKGSNTFASSVWNVEYSPVGAGLWTTVDSAWTHSGPRLETVRVGLRWTVPTGQYDVRMTHVGTTYADFEGGNEITTAWIALRSIRSNKRAFDEPGVVVMAMRIKSTDQVNGLLQNLTVEATSLLQAWNGIAWVEQATGNPAWVYADIISGTANARPLPRSRLDTTELLAWANDADAQGRAYNGIFDSATTVLDAMRQVAANGRASWSMSSDAKIGVVRERGTEMPRLIVSPRNSFDFSFDVLFSKLPHAFRVQYTDAVTYEDTERIVYDDGFDESNATEFEILQTNGVTNADQAWKDGRFHFAQARLRPLIYRFSQDVQHLIYRRGDTITLAHDEILAGLGWGRVKSTVEDINGDAIQITVDQLLVMEPLKNYGVRIQKNDGSISVVSIVNASPFSSVIDLSSPVSGVERGNHFTFGLVGLESTDVKVTKIEPRGDFKANITCVPAAPNILDAETGLIPPAENFVSTPADPNSLPPPVPVITGVRSDESVLVRDPDGSLRIRMLVSLSMLAMPGSGTLSQVRFRDQQSNTDYLMTQPVESLQVSVDNVQQGRSYDVQARTLRGALSSAWSPVVSHTVIGKSSAPSNVVSFSAAVARDRVLLKWSDIDDADRDEFELRSGGSDWDTASFLTRTSSLEFQTPAPMVGPFWIKATDTSQNFSVSATQAVLTVAPPVVSGLTVQVIDNNVLLRWTTSPGTFDMDTHEIRRGAVKATAEVIGDTSSTFDVIFELASGTFVYWVVPFDKAGVEGTAASIVANVNEPPDFKFLNEFATDWQGLDFTSANLVRLGDGSAIVMFPATEIMSDKLTVHGYATPQDQINAGFAYLAQPHATTATLAEIYDAGAVIGSTKIDVLLNSVVIVSGVSASIMISTKQLIGDPWTDFGAGLASVFATNFQFIKVTVDFTGTATSMQLLNSLQSVLSVKRKTDAGIITVSANPTTVPITGFVDIQSIELTPIATVSRHAVSDFADVPNPTSFDVYLFDSAGAPATGDVSYRIGGV